MEPDRNKPRKPAANSSRSDRPKPAPTAKPVIEPRAKPVARAANPSTKPAATKSSSSRISGRRDAGNGRIGWIVGGGAIAAMVIVGAVGLGYALRGAVEPETKKSPVAMVAKTPTTETKGGALPKASSKDVAPKTSPSVARTYVVRQVDGAIENPPPEESAPSFRVDEDAPAEAGPMAIDVKLTDVPGKKTPPDMSLDLDEGPYEAGKPFSIRASIVPKADDSVTLLLPPTIQLVKAEPIGAVMLGTAVTVEWKLQANGPVDPTPIRVALKSGASIERRIAVKVLKSESPTVDFKIVAGPKDNTYALSAFVENTKAGQKITVRLPTGVQRLEGEESLPAPQPSEPGKPTVVEWSIKIDENGSYSIAVELSDGPQRKKTLVVDRKPPQKTGPFTLSFEGDIEPGKTCTLVAEIPDPAPGQTLTLELPRGMILKEGPETQSATPSVAQNPFDLSAGATKLRWQLRPNSPGSYPVRVSSSTGLARTRILSIDEKR